MMFVKKISPKKNIIHKMRSVASLDKTEQPLDLYMVYSSFSIKYLFAKAWIYLYLIMIN